MNKDKFLSRLLGKLGFKGEELDKGIENLKEWSVQVRTIESDNNPMASPSTSSAKGVYQFTDASVQTGKNRMYNMGFDKNSIREIDNNPQLWSDEQADAMFFANVFAQRGSDPYIKKIAKGDIQARKDAYYKFHHTDPDEATIKRVNKIIKEK
tara:strand:- start:80 stop:538 length:459 start_codon:yes stop_codon:yes gene_type:complete